MSISSEKLVIKHKTELLKLYSAFLSGLELDIALDPETNYDSIKKRSCLLAFLSFKHKNNDLDFSIDKDVTITRADTLVSDELYSIVLCEEHVKKGLLLREGDFYISNSNESFSSIPKYKKYIRVV